MPVNDCIQLINTSEYAVPFQTLKRFQVFTFKRLLHPEKLAPIISKLCDAIAEPNYVNRRYDTSLQLDVPSFPVKLNQSILLVG